MFYKASPWQKLKRWAIKKTLTEQQKSKRSAFSEEVAKVLQMQGSNKVITMTTL